MDIASLTINDLDTFNPMDDPPNLPALEEVLHFAEITGNILRLPVAPPLGQTGKVPPHHVLLKSGNHSNGFINLKPILKTWPKVRMLYAFWIANQIEIKIKRGSISKPKWLAGIPEAATELCEDVSTISGIPYLGLEKDHEGNMVFSDNEADKIEKDDWIMIIEDLCSFGTGVSEAIRMIHKNSDGTVLPSMMYILNRGTTESVTVEVEEYSGEDGWPIEFEVKPLAKILIDVFPPGKDTCPYCANGSEAISPKHPEQNWDILKALE